MLSRGGSATYQKIVQRLSDLPSPLDATPGEKIIVRETQEVYGLDPTTRVWQVIGVLKKVGGPKPEDISAHLEGTENPHVTTLQQAISAGSQVVTKSTIDVRDTDGTLKSLLHLLARSGATITIGELVKDPKGDIWVNGGAPGKKRPILRVVDGTTGEPRFEIDSDGSIRADGSLALGGEFLNPAAFRSKITAGGMVSAQDPSTGVSDGNSLQLAGGRQRGTGKPGGIEFLISDQAKPTEFGNYAVRAVLNAVGLGIGTTPKAALDVAGDMRVSGVSSDLTPSADDKFSLGNPAGRWKSLYTKRADIRCNGEAGLSVKGSHDQKVPFVQVGVDGGEILNISGQGNVGLGTEDPEARLDVRGSGIAVGKSVGGARVTLADAEDGDVRLCYDRHGKTSPYSWSLLPGNAKHDKFEISRRGKAGWRALLTVTDESTTVGGDLGVQGSIGTAGKVVTSSIASRALKSGIDFGDGSNTNYYVDSILTEGYAHGFSALWGNDKKDLVGLIFDVEDGGSGPGSSLLRLLRNSKTVFDFSKDGDILPGGEAQALGSQEFPWKRVYASGEVHVGGLVIADGEIRSGSSLSLNAAKGLTVSALKLADGRVEVSGDELEVVGKGGNRILIGVGAKPGLKFLGGGVLSGITQLESLPAKLTKDNPFLNVSQTWMSPNETFHGVVIDVRDQGSSPDSALAAFSLNNKVEFAVYKDETTVSGALNVGGLRYERVSEELSLSGARTESKLKIPAGVRVEAVVIKILSEVKGARIWQVGDASTPDRFLGPTTQSSAGSVLKGLNHCDRGQSVQLVSGSVILTADAPVTGRVELTVFYVNPTA